MKKSFLFCVFSFIIAINSLSAAIYWDGSGTPGDWEDPANWDKNRVPKEGDDVIIDGAYNVTLESSPTIESLRLFNGASLTIAAPYILTVFDNNGDGIKLEHTGTTLTVNGTLNSYDHGGNGIELDSMNTTLIVSGTLNAYNNGDHGVLLGDEGSQFTLNGTLNAYDNNDNGVLIDGYNITMTLNGTLNAHNNGDNGVALDGSSSGEVTLIVNGTLNSYENSKRGIEVKRYSFLIIPASGKIYLSDNADDGIILEEDVTNDGLISILNSGKIGLNTGGSPQKDLINNGTITISGAIIGIDGKDTNWDITNNGTISVSNADTLVDAGTDIFTYGTFKADGRVENGNNYDMTFHPGSTVIPGTSIGKITFLDKINFSGVNLNIEIDGPANYDQVLVDTGMHGPATVILTGAILNLSGSYTPVAGDEFMILEKVLPGAITGTFAGLPNNSILVYKGGELMISYTGGDGNDVTLTSLGALPVELVEFNARAMEKEVKLTWATASEINNDYFTIERSDDGRSFENLGIIPGNGNSLVRNEYSFMDNNPSKGLNYYRLKQTDFDGQFSYSDIKTVEFKNNETIKVYPTMVNGVVTVETGNDFDDELTITIRDITGRNYQSIPMTIKSNKVELSLDNLIPGIYFVVVTTDTTAVTQKIIKL